jgi:hypothetical protein
MFYKTKVAVCSAIRTKHINAMWAPCRIFYFQTWRYVKLPLGFKRLMISRSQWRRRLGHGSAAARLLHLWVRIPPGIWCLSLVSVACCQVEVSASGWSLVQRSPTEYGVPKCAWSWSPGNVESHVSKTGRKSAKKLVDELRYTIYNCNFKFMYFDGLKMPT